jgi:hypothetical protein
MVLHSNYCLATESTSPEAIARLCDVMEYRIRLLLVWQRENTPPTT